MGIGLRPWRFWRGYPASFAGLSLGGAKVTIFFGYHRLDAAINGQGSLFEQLSGLSQPASVRWLKLLNLENSAAKGENHSQANKR